MPTPTAHYRQRFRRLLAHIDANLDTTLTLANISALAHSSKYHFHRQFSALFGLSFGRYLQLSRIKRAAYTLAYRDTRVLDIALTSGYESNEAFSRAFKQTVGQTPSEFRAAPRWQRWHTLQQPLTVLRSNHMKPEHHIEDVAIITFPETRVAALEHRGTAANIGESIRRFIDWRRRNRLPPKVSATYNLQHQSHPEVADGEYHVDLCAATDAPIAPNPEGVVAKVMPEGRCAVLRHKGSDDTLSETVMFIYATWLPGSGQEVRDYPLFFQRVEFFPDVPEQDAVTDVFLPIR